MRTAIVTTLLNEARRLPEFLESLERQTRMPDEVIVTDGGSTDGSQQILRDFAARTRLPFQWAIAPGNRSHGRNEAIRRSTADAIAVADMGVLAGEWFSRIIAPLESESADLVVGWYEISADTRKERCIGLLTQFSLDQVRPDTVMANSRSMAFTRNLWERAGGYPEPFEAGEDTVFEIVLQGLCPRRVFVPEAVLYYRPPGTARGLYRQYRAYAVGDAQAGIFFTRGTRYALYYSVWGGGLVLALAGFLWWPLWLLLGMAAAGYFAARIRKIPRAKMWSSIPYAVSLVAVWDVARIVGYTVGRLDRLRRGVDAFRYSVDRPR